LEFKELFELIKRIVIGTVSGTLIKVGVAFLIFGMWDVAIYFFDSYVMGKTVEHPGDSFGWIQWLGLSCFFTGLIIKSYSYFKENSSNLRAERLWLKENYLSLSDAKLQDEFERLYRRKNADVRAIKNIFNHPYNKNLVISLFTKCHVNVVPEGDWFIEKGRYLNLRYNLGFLIWCLLPVLIFLSLVLSAAEYLAPGITKSGPYATQGFLILAGAATVGAKLLLSELASLGQAVALVRDNRP
jgi:hypothetical protein